MRDTTTSETELGSFLLQCETVSVCMFRNCTADDQRIYREGEGVKSGDGAGKAEAGAA